MVIIQKNAQIFTNSQFYNYYRNEYKSRMMTGAFTLNAQIQNCIEVCIFLCHLEK